MIIEEIVKLAYHGVCSLSTVASLVAEEVDLAWKTLTMNPKYGLG